MGKLQQHGLVRIVYNPSIDEEPLVQLTEKGKQEAIELLFPGDLKPRAVEKTMIKNHSWLVRSIVRIKLSPSKKRYLKGKKFYDYIRCHLPVPKKASNKT